MFQPRLILHPTDYSENANNAFAVAVDIARNHQARLLILHVAETLGPERVSFGEAAAQRQPDGHRHLQMEQLLHVRPAADSGIAFRHILAEGDPASVIVSIATREHCDLIVMGTYGRKLLSRFLTGSVTSKVAQLARCTVLMVRPPEADAHG